MIKLAADLGLDVVAEGVETAEQAKLLGELGCRYAQGYLWARAMPLDALTPRCAPSATKLRTSLHRVTRSRRCPVPMGHPIPREGTERTIAGVRRVG